MKLCIVCSEYPPIPYGGIGRLTQILARAYIQRGHTVRVIGVYSQKHNVLDYEEDEGVKVWRIWEDRHHLGWIFARVKLFQTIRKWIKRGQVDIIEVPDYAGWAAGWLTLPVPVVIRLSGSSSYVSTLLNRRSSAITFILEKMNLLRGDAYISESSYLLKMTEVVFKMSLAPNAVIYNPVDLPANPSDILQRIKNRIIYSGTLNENKGVLRLMQAWPLVKQQVPDAELYLYGKDGSTREGKSMRAYLINHYSKQLKANVYLMGFVERTDLLKAMKTARMIVLPSIIEGFALAPLESMSYGCPTIFTRNASGPELITHGVDGLLVDPLDPQDIAQAVVHLLKDDELANRLGQTGRRTIENRFSLARIISQNESFFEQTIKEFMQSSIEK